MKKEKTTEEVKKRLIKQVIESGHTSTLEHATFTFSIDGVSRDRLQIHLIRHRIASFSIQSGRYVKRGDAAYKVPPAIRALKDKKLYEKYLKHLDNSQKLYNELTDAGIKAEDARFCQPQSVQIKMVMSMNARELFIFLCESCIRAQWEIREISRQMLDLVKEVAPNIFENAGAPCVSEKLCDQGKLSCGLWKTITGSKFKENE